MNINRRNIDLAFWDAVQSALEAGGQRHDDTHVNAMCKMLTTNVTLNVRRNGKWTIIENPHYLGRDVAEIPKTIKEIAP